VVNAKKRELLEVVELKGSVRDVVSKVITLENPTTITATFTGETHILPQTQLIWLVPNQFEIKPGESLGVQVN